MMNLNKFGKILLCTMMLVPSMHSESFAKEETALHEVLYLNFDDGTAKDASGKNNHGEEVGTLEYVDGPMGKALHIQNSKPESSSPADQYLKFNNANDLKFGTDNFTISFMFKQSSDTPNGGTIIGNKNYNSGGNPGFAFAGFSDDGTRFNYTFVDGERKDFRPVTPNSKDWQHVVLSFDRAGKAVTYVNGVKSKESDITTEAGKSLDALDFVIGADGSYANSVKDLYIDEVRVYKDALDASQVTSIFEKISLEEKTDEVLYLNFNDETVNDKSPSKNNGEIVGSPEYVDGPMGKALHIQNSKPESSSTADQYVKFNNAEDLKFGADNFTISFMFKQTSNTTNGGTIIGNKNYNSGSNPGFAFAGFSDDGTRFNYTFVDGNRKDFRPVTPNSKDWQHVVLSFDRAGKAVTYVNGVKKGETDITSESGKSLDAFDFVIGADGSYANSVKDLYIDEVRVFRTAKTEVEVQELFSNIELTPQETPSGDEILYANFDDNVKDTSSYNNHGNAVGNPTYVDGISGKALHILNENGSTSAKAKQYVDFGNKVKFGSDDFSLSYWYRSDNGVSNGGAFISNKDFNSGGNTGFNIGNFDNGFRTNFTADGGSRKDIYGFAPIDGVWHHVVVNVDRSDKITTYVDGVESKSVDISSDAGKSIDVNNFVVGADGLFCNGLNDAYIDELHVYKALLEKTEIDELYYPNALSYEINQAEAFYSEATKNTLYDQTKLAALATTIEDAKKVDTSDAKAVGIAMNGLKAAVQALKDSADIVDGMLMYLNFDESNANDASGRENHGNVVGGITYEDGLLGKAAHIQNPKADASAEAKQYINFGKAEDLQFTTKDFALSFWYKTVNGGGEEAAIISNKNWASGSNPGFTIGNFGDSIRANFTGQGLKRSDIYGISANDDTWHYVVVNFDRDNKMSAYVDGQLSNSASIADAANVTIDAEDFVIGADGLKTQGLNDAYIDEVRVFNRLIADAEMDDYYVPTKLTMRIAELEKVVADAKAEGMIDEAKITEFEAVITEVKEEAKTADVAAAKKLIKKLGNAYDRFQVGEKPLFSFQVIADPHIGGVDETQAQSANLIDALQDIEVLDPDSGAVVYPGDLTDGGGANQYTGFFDIIDNYSPSGSVPVSALGNHDVRWLCDAKDRNEAGLTIPTCKEGTSPFKDRYLSRNKKYMDDAPEGQLYYDRWIQGYHFIVLNTEKDIKDQAYLSPEQLAWLRTTLAEDAAENKPIFITIHQTFEGTADHEELDVVGQQEAELKEILSDYPQSVIFTGHVHNGIDLAGVHAGTWGHLVDVPCFWYQSYGDKRAQIGYQVNVFEDEIEVKPRDFKNDVWLNDYTSTFKLNEVLPEDDKKDIAVGTMSATSGSEHAGDEASNVLDNDPSSIWHTEWSGSTVEKNYVTLDLGSVRKVDGIRYLPRQNSTNGMITEYDISVSSDGTNFTSVAKGTWKTDKSWKLVNFTETDARYVKVNALAAINGTNDEKIAAIAELRVTTPSQATIDKSGLSALIDTADKKVKADYTEASWGVFETALKDAKTILNKENATKTEVEAATKTLQEAIDQLKAIDKVDFSALKTVVDEAEKKVESAYTSESWNAFKTTLTAAKEVLANTKATQKEVDDAKAGLSTAMDALVVKETINRDALSNTIKEAEKKVESAYTSESWNAFKTTLTEAKEILAKDNATQKEIDDVKAELSAAMSALIEKEVVNRDALKNAIEEANNKIEVDYTSESWRAFEVALIEAKTTCNNADATQKEIDEAYHALQEATNNLKQKEVVNVSELEKVIEKVAKLNKADYTLASWNKVQVALDNAKKVIAENPTQTAISEAKESLEYAISQLVLVEQQEITNESGNIVIRGTLPKGVKLVSQAMQKNEIKAILAKIKDKTLLKDKEVNEIFDIRLFLKGNTHTIETDLLVGIKLDAELIKKNPGIVYISEDGVVESIKSYVKDGMIYFTVSHLSNYAIITDHKNSDIIPDVNPDLDVPKVEPSQNGTTSTTPNTGDETSMACVSLLILSGAVLLELRRRNKKQDV